MKLLMIGFLSFSINVFSHSAKEKDMEGAWILVESKWNNELMQLCKPACKAASIHCSILIQLRSKHLPYLSLLQSD